METRTVIVDPGPLKGTSRGNFEGGETVTLPKAEADAYIANGWVKDAETGETGERKPGAGAAVVVQDVTQPAA